ncbi:MAG: M15 family metallopeptidase [Pyrinomonadaceae bacterium]|nr:M15 family metallopeptidase [Pyrinomonadaceae bacterium]
MRVLRRGLKGPDVKEWQIFLIGRKIDVGLADGDFGKKTEAGTKEFQREQGLEVDGIVGNQTMGEAMKLGFEAIKDTIDDSKSGPNFPPQPDLRPLPNTAARQRVFGKFTFRAAPRPGNPENIIITDDFEQKNIVRVVIPQLVGISQARPDGAMRMHRLVVNQLVKLFDDWGRAKLINRILTFDGDFVPRFVRGSRTELSNHSFGSAFDINARFNVLGTVPALVGMRGSTRELVTIAAENGFFWGGFFRRRKDGNHFEVARIIG